MKITGFAAGPFQTNCYLVVNDDAPRAEAFVVDPGLGAHPRAVELAQREGAELVAVVLTHGHIDHVRDAAAFGLETFIHAADAFMLDPEEETLARLALPFDVAHMEKTERVTHVADGEVIEVAGIQLRARHAPGHSPGSTLFLGADFVLSGDVLFRGSVGRTDLPHSSPSDMRESLRGPVWEIPDSLAVLPGHGPTTTMAHERATNPYLLEANAALD
ncbi:MBL fold metallo-hydrolase [Corynebacterium auris]|uniref:MBL fold metallo-hydrolase n=1 Tax=Corynebacterium auris TaxID=44750 RepID=UPI0025B5F60D|nr:MBL fold metallo-hydrolase [Corynebacterium auris]WJY68170.1 putative metallo-hydrolase [Corynebacterium auris]